MKNQNMKLQMQGMKVVYLPRKNILYKFSVFLKSES